MMNIKLISTTFLLIMLAACASFPAASDPLDGTSWELYAYRKTRPIEGQAITIRFEDGQVSGSAGCNSFGGSYRVKGDRISFGELFSTLMACLEPEGIMEQEQLFLGYLGDAQRFEIVDGQLQIFQSAGEALTFIPAE